MESIGVESILRLFFGSFIKKEHAFCLHARIKVMKMEENVIVQFAGQKFTRKTNTPAIKSTTDWLYTSFIDLLLMDFQQEVNKMTTVFLMTWLNKTCCVLNMFS